MRPSARYRTKTDDDLVWNRIRRQITRDLDTEIANRREEALNVLLDEAFRRYAKMLDTGELKQLEADYSGFVSAIVSGVVPRPEDVSISEDADDSVDDGS